MEKHRFNLHLPGLLKVLAEHLYSTKKLGVRELIQNAHDSCVRRKIEEGRGDYQPRIDLAIDSGVEKGTGIITGRAWIRPRLHAPRKDPRPLFFRPDPLAVPDRAITEWAACGVACMLVPAYTPLRILSVAAYGDRFDYWLNDGQKDYGLEISGTVAGELEPRHRVKVNQLLANPYGIDGYVAVVAFETKTAIFSFHPSQEPAE